MNFKKYQHVERFGTTEVGGIEIGTCYIFPKIDGTNISAWLADGDVCFGSRNREISLDSDHFGFFQKMSNNPVILDFFRQYPDLRLFGEYLVQHTLKTYRDDAWGKYYIFDVVRDLPEEHESGKRFEYLPYDEYQPILEDCGLDYIPCIAKIANGNYDKFLSQLDANSFLIKDGCGVGEGIVIKNYQWANRFGRTTWAKIVRNQFKEQNQKIMGPSEKPTRIGNEENIIEEFCTPELIQKTKAKIVADNGGWSSDMIPRLLGTVYYDLIREECWNFIKKHKNPIVDFKRLKKLSIAKIKQEIPELL